MANINKSKNLGSTNKETIIPEVIKDIEKEELIKKNKEQENKINELTNKNQETLSTLEILQKQMQDIQAAFIKMSGNNSNLNNVNNSEKKYDMSCRLISGITLFSLNRDVSVEILCNEVVSVTEYEMSMLLKNSQVRDFIINDVVYFINEEDYERAKIVKRKDLSEEKLIDIVLNSNSNDLIKYFNEMTNNKHEDAVIHSLFYSIISLYVEGKIARMTWEIRQTVEKYFQYTIQNGTMLIENIKKVK